MKLKHNPTSTILGELPLDYVLDKAMARHKCNKLEHDGKLYALGRMKVFGVHGCKCYYCGLKGTKVILTQDAGEAKALHLDLFAERKGSYILMNRDHIIPASKGGTNTVWNMRPTCQPCNTKRGNVVKPEDEKLAKIQMHMKSMYCVLSRNTNLSRGMCYKLSFLVSRFCA